MKPVIIIVDDERIVADSMSMYLNRTGEFDAYPSYDIEGVREQARDTPPALILLDVIRPAGRGGMEDACFLRKKFRCPVLLMSGAALRNREIECPPEDTGGAFQLLLKPIAPPELLAQIKHFLATGKIMMTPSQQ